MKNMFVFDGCSISFTLAVTKASVPQRFDHSRHSEHHQKPSSSSCSNGSGSLIFSESVFQSATQNNIQTEESVSSLLIIFISGPFLHTGAPLWIWWSFFSGRTEPTLSQWRFWRDRSSRLKTQSKEKKKILMNTNYITISEGRMWAKTSWIWPKFLEMF